MNLYEEFGRVVDVLADAGIEYALCGGVAVAFHGYARFTRDIDLLVRAEDLSAVKRALAPIGFKLEAGPIPFDAGTPRERVIHRVSKVDGEDLLTIDLLILPSVLAEVWRTREVYDWEGRRVFIVSAGGLAQMKRLAGRGQDLVDLAQLEGENGET
jgi:hypothetical protein